MRWRQVGPVLALVLFSGCHRLTGYGDDTYGEGTFRHYAGLDFGFRMTVTLCAFAIVGGSVVVVHGIVNPRKYNRGRMAWAATLVVFALVAGLRVYWEFGDIGYCC